MTQEKLSFSDLSALDSSPAAVLSKFESIYGVRPDGIALNNETYYDAVTPPITEQYSHYCYKTLEKITFGEGSVASPTTAVVGRGAAENTDPHQEAEMTVAVEGIWTETTAWSSSVTTGMTFSEEINLEGVFKIGMSFSVTATVGQSGSSSVQRRSSTTIKVKVPPRSIVRVQLVATMRTETLHFSSPIRVSGMFGANFPHPIPDTKEGSYFLFNDASSLLPKTAGELTGTIEGASAFDVNAVIGPAEPIP